MLDGFGVHFPQDLVRDFPNAAHELIARVGLGPGVLKLAARIANDFSTNVEVAGLNGINYVGGKCETAVVIPTAHKAAEDALGSGHRGVVFAFPKGSGGIEVKGEFAILL